MPVCKSFARQSSEPFHVTAVPAAPTSKIAFITSHRQRLHVKGGAGRKAVGGELSEETAACGGGSVWGVWRGPWKAGMGPANRKTDEAPCLPGRPAFLPRLLPRALLSPPGLTCLGLALPPTLAGGEASLEWHGPVRQAWDLKEAVPPPPPTPNLVQNSTPGSPALAGSSREPDSPKWQRALRLQQLVSRGQCHQRQGQQTPSRAGSPDGSWFRICSFLETIGFPPGTARTRGRRGRRGGGQLCVGTSSSSKSSAYL